MGIENLIDSICAVLRKLVAGMLLPVNVENEFNEETVAYSPPPEEPDTEDEALSSEAEDEPAPDLEPEAERWQPKTLGEARKRPPEVWAMNLPERSDTVSRVPYLLVQFLSGSDKYDKDTEDEHSLVKVRILIATYNPDGQDGGMQVIRIIDAIRIVFCKGMLLQRRYMMQKPLKFEVYPDDTGDYYLGEIEMEWTIPEIKREKFTIEECLGDW